MYMHVIQYVPNLKLRDIDRNIKNTQKESNMLPHGQVTVAPYLE